MNQAAQNFVRIKIRLGQSASGPAVAFIVTLDSLRAGNSLLQCLERDQALADRVIAAKAGILDQGRFARSEVTHRAVAKPTACGLDINPLGDRAFGTRGLD